MQDVLRTVISQYGNSPVILALVDSFNSAIDPALNFDAFHDMIWDVSIAQGYGLDVWGRIVGVQRILQVAAGKYWGFVEAGTIDADPYSQSPFYTGSALTSNFALSDDAYRQLIFAKALANITDGGIPSINQILLTLFPGRGNCYVVDGLDGTMTYTFTFALTLVEVAMVTTSGVLPRPPGVTALYVIP
jgi:hypothetical protein